MEYFPKKSLKAHVKTPVLLPLDLGYNQEFGNCLEQGTRLRSVPYVSIPGIPVPFLNSPCLGEENLQLQEWEKSWNITDLPILDTFLGILGGDPIFQLSFRWDGCSRNVGNSWNSGISIPELPCSYPGVTSWIWFDSSSFPKEFLGRSNMGSIGNVG